MNILTFNELYRKYADDVHRFAFWLCGDADTADDITMETFERAWLSDADIRLETVKAYLLKIARNCFLRQRQSQKKKAPLSETIVDGAVLPDKNLELMGDVQLVLAAMQRLPEIDRTVLLLRAEEGLPYEEIARLTGLSLSSVKVKVFRARAKLSKDLNNVKGESQ
jgi:RNA polymerase sigma-70 factor (ECF subfamily)